DYRMPQMNGVEFLHRARQLRPRAMRILLSGQADREVIIEAVNDGEIARYLDKPWDDQELVDVIEAADRVANERAEDVARSMALEHDVTEIRSRLDEAVAALERARECDVVTGLPNRSAFVARAERLMCSNAERTHEVLVLGLGGLDLVRASEGYEGADALLCEVSRKVAGQIRDEDLVARVGDDLFAILLDDAHGIAGAERVARRILEELARPTYHAGRALLITGKIGIACAPEHGERAETLLTNAQTALTLARSSGLQMDVYSPGMTDEAHSRLRLEHRLRLAVESEAFTLAYQPRFRASDGRLIAAEALLRWHDEELGHIG
ncbi:MAG: diguanylate cyclase, partial [Gammaproteobacteria bacterium]|nr:diguanylate cyclase [Gammaproteobacteria bacterium]